jgi:hypothetical protein
MRWSRISTLFLPADDKRFRWLQARFGSFATGADASGKTPPSRPPRKNIALFRISDLWHTPVILALPKGRSRPSRHAGRVAVGRGSDGAGGGMTGRATVSPHATRTTRRWRAGSSVIGGEHTQALDDLGGTVRGRRSRVVLTPGVCASSLAVMWRPDRARASAIGQATGAIVHRSPGRARRTPLKPSAQGRPGDRPPHRSTPCAFL